MYANAYNNRMHRICILPFVDGLAGVASFRIKFEDGLRSRGVDVSHDPSEPSDAILVLGGTRNILPLGRARSRGMRIIQRLDGINWIHKKRSTGLRHYLRAEYGNLVLSFIRSRIATGIIYQSEFSRKWWEDWYGKTKSKSHVILNGVDLNTYSPLDIRSIPSAPPYKILILEGSFGGGYESGLDNAVRLSETLIEKHKLQIKLMVVGKISEVHREKVMSGTSIQIQWMGSVPREQIPSIDRSVHVLFSGDLNAACPNSVIEAMACGLPVASFDTGALNELVLGDSGRLVAYGGDPWNVEQPDIPALADATAEILYNQPRFRKQARAQAEEKLGLDKMVDAYLKVLLD